MPSSESTRPVRPGTNAASRSAAERTAITPGLSVTARSNAATPMSALRSASSGRSGSSEKRAQTWSARRLPRAWQPARRERPLLAAEGHELHEQVAVCVCEHLAEHSRGLVRRLTSGGQACLPPFPSPPNGVDGTGRPPWAQTPPAAFMTVWRYSPDSGCVPRQRQASWRRHSRAGAIAHADGTLDPAFNGGAVRVGTNAQGLAWSTQSVRVPAVVQADGRIVVGGASGGAMMPRALQRRRHARHDVRHERLRLGTLRGHADDLARSLRSHRAHARRRRQRARDRLRRLAVDVRRALLADRRDDRRASSASPRT